jgi:hypothetical protein
MAKLKKADFDHLVKKHFKAGIKSGKICVTLTLQCSKTCTVVVNNVHFCRYPPCPC